jgi:hypothetical protein
MNPLQNFWTIEELTEKLEQEKVFKFHLLKNIMLLTRLIFCESQVKYA